MVSSKCQYCGAIINRIRPVKYCNAVCKNRYHDKLAKRKPKKIKSNPVRKLKKICSVQGCGQGAIGFFEGELYCTAHMRIKKIGLIFINNQENKVNKHKLKKHRCPECWKILTRPHQWFCNNKCRNKYSFTIYIRENKLNSEDVQHLLINA